jgi:hypothetical protein
MTPRRKGSRKQSGANSIDARRLSQAVFYLDESIFSHVLLETLLAAGATVRRVGVDVPYGSADDVWLSAAGAHGWIALMRDQRIRRRPLELTALQAAGVAAFVFTGGQATAQDTAAAIVPRLIKFANMAVSEPRPFLYTFGRSGRLSRVKLGQR